MPSDRGPCLHALLIGVGGYLQNARLESAHYLPLSGSVGDVERVQAFLERFLAVPAERVVRLTASGIGDAEPPEPPERRPTYANMVAGFWHLLAVADPGDQVYIHYSGHGGRASTAYPELKGQDGLDETLVPYDIHGSSGQYLRDVEISYLLDVMEERGILVTLVLDCCYAGGATRGRARQRDIADVDSTKRGTASKVASRGALLARWRARDGPALTAPGRRWLDLSGRGLAPRAGLVVLAACHAQQQAFEDEFRPDGWGGVLTHWFLDTLRQGGPHLTYKLLYDRLLARITSEFPRQVPMLVGDAGRVVFGFDRVEPQDAVRVLKVDEAANQVILSTGTLEGVSAGSRFAIFPLGADISQRDGWIARVEIECEGLELQGSSARIAERRPPGWPVLIEPGALAVLLDPGSLDLSSGIRLFERRELPAAVRQREALSAVREEVVAGGGFLYLAQGDQKVHFCVAVDEKSCYEILDASAQSVPNLRPPLPIAAGDSAVRVVQRLVHLTKFRNISQVDVVDPSVRPSIEIDARLLGYQSNYIDGHEPKPAPFAEHGNLAELEDGEWTFLQIENCSVRDVEITILNLRPDWGIEQLYPAVDGSFVWPLARRQSFERPFAFQVHLPTGYREGTSILKVIATPRAANFRWLELPPLDQPLDLPQAHRAGEAPVTSAVRSSEVAGPEWATVHVRIRVLPKGALRRRS